MEKYNRRRIAWELERTALGDGFYGNALRVAKDLPGVTDDDRALLDRWATGRNGGTDHVGLQDLALRIDAVPDDIKSRVPDIKPVDWPRLEYFHDPDAAFDGTEVSLCIEYDHGADNTYIEAVNVPAHSGKTDVEVAREILADRDSHAVRAFWTLYGHVPAGGVQALVDTDYETATRLAAALEVCIRVRKGLDDDTTQRLVRIALDPH